MKNFEFNKEVKDILLYYYEDGYEIGENLTSGGTASVYEVIFGKEKLIGKKYDDESFMHPYREFLLEFNIKSEFSIQPRALYKDNGEYFLVMDCFRQLTDFPNYFKKSALVQNMKDDSSSTFFGFTLGDEYQITASLIENDSFSFLIGDSAGRLYRIR